IIHQRRTNAAARHEKVNSGTLVRGVFVDQVLHNEGRRIIHHTDASARCRRAYATRRIARDYVVPDGHSTRGKQADSSAIATPPCVASDHVANDLCSSSSAY